MTLIPYEQALAGITYHCAKLIHGVPEPHASRMRAENVELQAVVDAHRAERRSEALTYLHGTEQVPAGWREAGGEVGR